MLAAEIEQATHVHLGGPEFMGGEAAAPLLARAREHGAVTSADVLAPGEPGLLDRIALALPELDYLLPNDDQVLALTGADELEDGCRALLQRCRLRGRDAWRGRRGHRRRRRRGGTVPAFEVEAVDTTGCGDAFSAGFLRGLALGRERREAAVLGCATAALVAQGLGTDYGDLDLAAS